MIQPKFDQYALQYDNATPIQSEVARYLWQKILTYQDEDLSQDLPITWLDVGCGTGKLSQALFNTDRKAHNFQLIALDKSAVMLEQFAQRLYRQQNVIPSLHAIQLLKADMTVIPLKNDSIDRLISSFALHWVSSKVLAELFRVTKTGGQIHLAIPVSGSLSAVQQSFPKLPIYPFLSADEWTKAIEKIRQATQGQWLYNEQRVFSHPYASLAHLLKSLKNMGGAVSGQLPMSHPILKQYLANDQPLALDYRVLVVGFRV